MPLSAKPFKDWNRQDLDALIADPPAVESPRLDFKADCGLLSEDKEKARRDLLKDISAMANGAGGALLIGVRQTGDPAEPPKAAKVEGIAQAERIRQSIDELVNQHLDIRPGALRFFPVTYDENLAVLVVEVPKNTYGLSMVTYKGLNQFWVRRGTDNRPMTTDEIQYRYLQFAKVRDAAAEEMDRIRAEVSRILPGPMVWFGGVPIQRSRDHIPVNLNLIRQTITESSYFLALSARRVRGNITPASFVGKLMPSLHGIATRNPQTCGAVLEIRRDGSLIFGAALPCQDHPCLAARRQQAPIEAILLWTIYEPLLSGLYLLADIQQKYGLGLIALAQAGINGCAGKVIVRDESYDDFSDEVMPVNEDVITLDSLLLDETWEPKQVFLVWATQLANAYGREQPLELAPWLDLNVPHDKI